MVEPITTALIVGAGSAAINAFTAYREGRISEGEYRRQIEAANELERQLKALRPDESWKDLDPKLLGEVAKYSPDIATFVEENAPQLIRETQSQAEKRIQQEALQKYAAMAETGRDVISEAQREQALYEAGARAKSRQQQLAEALRRQGQLGSGQARALQFQTEQAEALSARQAALQGVQESELRRRQALGQAASLAGQIRQQNVNVESSNVGTMNAYNQRLANSRNLYNQYVSGETNRAQAINQQRQAERERYNLDLQNRYAMYNLEQSRAARERARQYDVDVTNRMFHTRAGAEDYRRGAQAKERAGYGTAVTSGLGAGLSAYGAANAGNFWEALGKSAATGAAQGLAQRAVSGQPSNYVLQSSQTGQLFNSMMPYNVPIDTTPAYGGPLRPPGQQEVIDETSETFTLDPYRSLNRG
jgi:hypothetical protein